jgi:integrase/recombinase XerD
MSFAIYGYYFYSQLLKSVADLADWRKVINQSHELKGIRMHDLRHTFATKRVGLMAIEELRALMGHENIHTTLHYQKITSSRAESVAKSALNNLVNNM